MPKHNKIHNIISAERGMELIKEGYFALDPHCHSSYSFDVPDAKETSPESVINAQKSRGLKNILTDHDTFEGHKYMKNKKHDIIPAVELTFKPRIARKIISKKPIQTLHINVFGLDNDDLIRLKEISKRGDLDELVRYFKNNGLEWMYNHPFYHEKKEKLNWKVIPELAKHYFDVIELNGTYSKGLNDINQRIAEKLGKGIVASSDSHTGNPGKGYVIAEGKNFKEFWNNVKQGNAYIVRKDMSARDIVREASLMINQAFDANTKRRSRKYTPSTGFEPFDDIATSVTSGRLKNSFIIKNIIRVLLQSIKYTAGPLLAWRLHVTKDEERAEKLRKKMRIVTERIKSFSKKFKHQKSDKIDNNSRIHHPRRTYYGMELVKASKNIKGYKS